MRTVNSMDYQPGCPAKSLAGQDKGRYYVILSLDGETVALVDGERRTQGNPKRKNRKHVQVDGHRLFPDFPVPDGQIRARLKDYVKRRSME